MAHPQFNRNTEGAPMQQSTASIRWTVGSSTYQPAVGSNSTNTELMLQIPPQNSFKVKHRHIKQMTLEDRTEEECIWNNAHSHRIDCAICFLSLLCPSPSIVFCVAYEELACFIALVIHRISCFGIY